MICGTSGLLAGTIEDVIQRKGHPMTTLTVMDDERGVVLPEDPGAQGPHGLAASGAPQGASPAAAPRGTMPSRSARPQRGVYAQATGDSSY